MRITIFQYLNGEEISFSNLVTACPFSFKYPVLCIVILLSTGDYLEVLWLSKVCIEEPTATSLSKGEPTRVDDIEVP